VSRNHTKPRLPYKAFDCEVISEHVQITLVRRRRSFASQPELFVQCSESACQHADANQPPCPLTVEMFAAELEAQAARRQAAS
jgi:mitochondrial fission protein ELM1